MSSCLFSGNVLRNNRLQISCNSVSALQKYRTNKLFRFYNDRSGPHILASIKIYVGFIKWRWHILSVILCIIAFFSKTFDILSISTGSRNNIHYLMTKFLFIYLVWNIDLMLYESRKQIRLLIQCNVKSGDSPQFNFDFLLILLKVSITIWTLHCLE